MDPPWKENVTCQLERHGYQRVFSCVIGKDFGDLKSQAFTEGVFKSHSVK